MSETDKAYSEHWNHCSDCQHQVWCEVGYQFRMALRTEDKEKS